jgi:enoyl-CoA hydratase
MSASYEVRDGVAVIALNNPPVNGLSYETRSAIAGGLERAQADASVHAIVLTGSGKAFSGGADIREFGSPKSMGEPNLPSLIRLAENATKPVVAAINGVCMGGGLELALGCHYRVAAPKVPVALPEVKIGLIPGAGGTQRLPRAVGKSKAMDMALTGRMMDAAEAERAGLVSRVVPLDKLMDEAFAAATAICALSGPSVAMAKEAVNRAFEGPLSDGVMFERRLFHSLFATEDQKEGMDAFLNKRNPNFKNA